MKNNMKSKAESTSSRRARRQLLKSSAWLLPTICALSVAQAFAQEQRLPSVTVTAQPLAGPTLPSLGEARREIATVPGGANVVDAEQYKQGRVST